MTNPLHGWTNQIHQGDALTILSQLPDESIGLIVTSPPYNLLNSTGNGARGQTGKWPTNKLTAGYPDHPDDMPRAEYITWQRSILTELVRILTPEGAIFYNHRPRIQAGIQESPREILTGFLLRDEIIWCKGGGINHHPDAMTPAYEVIYQLVKSPTGFHRAPDSVDYTNVWNIPRERDNDHPAPFPVELPRRCIQASTAPVILDPFIGSGSTAVAAIIEGRQYIGIELNAKYCQAARLRILSASRSLVATDPTIPPSDPTLPDSPAAIAASELKPRDRAVWDHIAALVTANQGRPIATSAQQIATALQTNSRRVERATAALKPYGLHIKTTGNQALYSIPAVFNQPAGIIPSDTNRPHIAGITPRSDTFPPESVGATAPSDTTPPESVGATAPKSVGAPLPSDTPTVKSVGATAPVEHEISRSDSPRPAGVPLVNHPDPGRPGSVGATDPKSVGAPPPSDTPTPAKIKPPCTTMSCYCETDYCQGYTLRHALSSQYISKPTCPKHRAPLTVSRRIATRQLPGDFFYCPSHTDGYYCTYLRHSDLGVLIPCDDPRGEAQYDEFEGLYHNGGRSPSPG